MLINRHQNITNAIKDILSLRKTNPTQDARVYMRNRLIYASYEQGRTMLLDLRGDERHMFKKLLRLMLS